MPVSEKQLAANRANARKSTGPRTPEGKAVSRYNALKHGILAQAVIPEALQDYESQEEFDRLHAALVDACSPANAIEELLVEEIAVVYWRLARLYRAEAGEIAKRRDGQDYELTNWDARLQPFLPPPDPIDQLKDDYEKLLAVWDHRRKLRAYIIAVDPSLKDAGDAELDAAATERLHDLRSQIEAHNAHQAALKEALRSIPFPDTALKYIRYETALQRQLNRALIRLERLQRLRGGGFVAPPIQIDISGAPPSGEGA